jgi:hypothetical protein
MKCFDVESDGSRILAQAIGNLKNLAEFDVELESSKGNSEGALDIIRTSLNNKVGLK